jgi:hypothetical protein
LKFTGSFATLPRARGLAIAAGLLMQLNAVGRIADHQEDEVAMAMAVPAVLTPIMLKLLH